MNYATDPAPMAPRVLVSNPARELRLEEIFLFGFAVTR
jgi:hypothetical protein